MRFLFFFLARAGEILITEACARRLGRRPANMSLIRTRVAGPFCPPHAQREQKALHHAILGVGPRWRPRFTEHLFLPLTEGSNGLPVLYTTVLGATSTASITNSGVMRGRDGRTHMGLQRRRPRITADVLGVRAPLPPEPAEAKIFRPPPPTAVAAQLWSCDAMKALQES